MQNTIKKPWTAPVAHRHGSFAELTLDPANTKTVMGSDSFCASPPTAQSPDRAGCVS